MDKPIANLYDIIPQRAPMVFIDSLVKCDENCTVTNFAIKPDCILLDNGELTAEGMLENIAQTCAARIGYLNLIAGATVKIGVIGAIKDFNLTTRPSLGENILTTIYVKEEIFGITLVDASIELKGKVIAQTTMKIALTDIESSDNE